MTKQNPSELTRVATRADARPGAVMKHPTIGDAFYINQGNIDSDWFLHNLDLGYYQLLSPAPEVAEKAVPKTFDDVRVGQRWYRPTTKRAVSITSLGERLHQTVGLYDSEEGTMWRDMGSATPFEHRWTFLGYAEPVETPVTIIEPRVTPQVATFDAKPDPDFYADEPDITGIADDIVFMAMTDVNERYRLARQKEIAETRRTFRQPFDMNDSGNASLWRMGRKL